MQNFTIDKSIIKSCYKKFKSYIYYSNYTYIKYKIVDFESDDNFEDTFNAISNALLNEDDNYFDKHISSISWISQIKKIHNDIKNNDCIISNNIDKSNVIVDKINYFIDMPIELYIIDVLWTILFGKCLKDSGFNYTHLSANNFAYGLFNDQTGFNGIDFDSIKLFAPYYNNYKKWRQGAIETAKTLYNDNQDCTIIALDLTEYFYNIEIDFNNLYKIVKTFDINLDFLTKLVEKIHKKYSNQLKTIKSNLKVDNILPIGLCSSCLLANYYLNDFDKQIDHLENVEYYSRYVDDMLLVSSNVSEYDNVKDIILESFSNVFVVDDEYIYIKSKPKCKIQNSKIKVIKLYANGSNSLLKSLETEVPNPSEANLMPDEISSDLKNLSNFIYNKEIDSLKIRDSEDLKLSKYKLMQFMSGYINFRRNTKNEDEDKHLKEILNVFDASNLFQLSDKWSKIFEFVYLAIGSIDLTKDLINLIEDNINNLILDNTIDIYQDKKDIVVLKLKSNLIRILIYNLASVLSINNVTLNNIDIYKESSSYSNKILHANMLNHKLMSLPLINYISDDYLKDKNLYETNNLLDFINKGKILLDKNKIEYSPRFVHLDEYMLFRQMINIDDLNDLTLIKNIIEEYENNFNKLDTKDRLIIEEDSNNRISKISIVDNTNILEQTNVLAGLSNIKLDTKEMIDGNKINCDNDSFDTLKNKKDLFKLLNECIKYKKAIINNVNYPTFLVFPELYIPFEWLFYLIYFSRKHNICVITGIRYIKYNNRIINSIATIIPFTNNNYHYSTLFIREKNDYAPNEKIYIKNTVNEVPSNESLYYLFNWNNIKFTLFDCYELTDITARSKFKNEIDIMFSIECNKDIDYFSNIIESAARDLGCFVVQVNTSNYGDTRIVGPCKRNYLNICSISGGEIDTIHIGMIYIDEYKKYKDYEKSDKFGNDINSSSDDDNKEVNLKSKYARSSAKVK